MYDKQGCTDAGSSMEDEPFAYSFLYASEYQIPLQISELCYGRSAQTLHQTIGAVAWRMLSILAVGTYWSTASMTHNIVAPHQLHL